DGPTLQEYVTEVANEITIRRLLQLLSNISHGLDEIHSHKMIHRDIKPDNVFISRSDLTPKIGDFGLSLTQLDFNDRLNVGIDAHGTPAYIAPEQIIGTSFDRRVDIYAFAMMVYYLLTQRFAYDFSSERDLLMAHIHQQPIPPSRRNPKWPESLDKSLVRSLSKNPERRHPSAQSLMRDVEQALAPFTPMRLASWQSPDFQRNPRGPEVAIKGVKV
ncbi:MAG: serine/threonine-protein kinase, partial [Candidatus Sumerlaeota bacterium]